MELPEQIQPVKNDLSFSLNFQSQICCTEVAEFRVQLTSGEKMDLIK